jgi:hypothetical protein
VGHMLNAMAFDGCKRFKETRKTSLNSFPTYQENA